MRKTGKSKKEEQASLVPVEHSEDETNGEEGLTDTNKKSKRKSKGKNDGNSSRQRKKISYNDDNENTSEGDESSSRSDKEEDVRLPKKMKMAKRKKETAEMEEEKEDKATSDVDDGSDKEDVHLSKKMKMAKSKKEPAEIEEEKEYEVGSVVGSRIQRGKRQFCIRWKGFSEEDDTWEAEEGLTCPDAIKAYLQDHPEDAEPEKKKGGKAKNSKGANKKKAVKEPTAKKEEEESEDEKGKVKTEEYEVDRVEDMYIKKNGKREFLIRWKGYSKKEETWEPEEHLHCGDLIEKYLAKVEHAVSSSTKELRQNRTHTERFTLSMANKGRRLSRRQAGKQRTRYHDAE